MNLGREMPGCKMRWVHSWRSGSEKFRLTRGASSDHRHNSSLRQTADGQPEPEIKLVVWLPQLPVTFVWKQHQAGCRSLVLCHGTTRKLSVPVLAHYDTHSSSFVRDLRSIFPRDPFRNTPALIATVVLSTGLALCLKNCFAVVNQLARAEERIGQTILYLVEIAIACVRLQISIACPAGFKIVSWPNIFQQVLCFQVQHGIDLNVTSVSGYANAIAIPRMVGH